MPPARVPFPEGCLLTLIQGMGIFYSMLKIQNSKCPGIYRAYAHHLPEHERSVATIDAMKSKSSKNNNSTINHKIFTPGKSFFNLSHRFRGTEVSHISTTSILRK
jgi:hypothetical protein